MSDSKQHFVPTATDQESLEYASEIAHNLVEGTYRSVPSYELRLAKAVIHLEEQHTALARAARQYLADGSEKSAERLLDELRKTDA